MKKVILISTSLRRGSNSDMLADRFAEGAVSAGNEVEKISLAGKNIQFCKGCLACQKLGRCVIDDDVNGIMAKVLEADVICWATPIYYYEMSGQMKTLIDRMNAMYALDYKFRDIYMLTTAAEGEQETPARAVEGLRGWIAPGRYALLRRSGQGARHRGQQPPAGGLRNGPRHLSRRAESSSSCSRAQSSRASQTTKDR